VVAAEAGAVAPVPTGLINGTWWRGGSQPPLDPFKVIAALRKLVDGPGLSDDKLLQFAGRPISLTGSELTGDFDALARGERVTIRETPRITRTDAAVPPAPAEPPRQLVGPLVLGHAPGRSPKAAHLIIDAVPRHLSAPRLCNEIDAQIQPEGWQPSEPPPGTGLRLGPEIRQQIAARALPIAEMRDESTEDDVRLAITLRPGADPSAVQEQLNRLHALAADRPAQFPAPLPELLRTWVATHRHEDITASLNRFQAAAKSDRRKRMG
jgi:hypothetical protein